MITNWVKRWNDGRVDNVSLRPEDISFQSVSFDVLLQKVVRNISDGNYQMKDFQLFNPYALAQDYKAFDVKCWLGSDNKPYVYIVYAQPDPEQMASNRYRNNLYFAKYDLLSKTWVAKDVNITKYTLDNHSVDFGERATINRYPSGKLWVCYVHDRTEAVDRSGVIYSRISNDDGVTWPEDTVRSAAIDNLQVIVHDENNIPNQSKKGVWKRLTYQDRCINNMMYRSEKANSKGANYFQFKEIGTDFYLYTYSTTVNYNRTKTKFVGTIQVYIDGKPTKRIDLSKFSGGYKHKIKLHDGTLAHKIHTVKICHISGKFMFIDAVEVHRNTGTNFILDDAIIRSGSIDANEAVMCIGEHDTVNNHRTLRFYIDRTGTASDFGKPTMEIQDYFTGDTKTYQASADWNAMFYESERGLYLQIQTEVNHVNRINTYFWNGSESKQSVFSAPQWSWLHSRDLPGGDGSDQAMASSKAVRYTISTTPDSNFAIYVTSLGGVSRRGAETNAYHIGMSPSAHFAPVSYEYEGDFLPVCAFNLPSYKSADGKIDLNGSCAFLAIDSSGNMEIQVVTISTETAMLEKVSDFVENMEISHDDTSDAGTLSLTFDNVDNLFNSRNQFGMFYGLLPTNYWDRDLRLVRVIANIVQKDYMYQTPLFTGMLTSMSEEYSGDGHRLSVEAMDYSKWLSLFNGPQFLVYANAPIEWMETASDYVVTLKDGYAVKAEPRNLYQYKVKDEATNEERTITVGWEIEKSKNPQAFKVDADNSCIVQSSYGILISPGFPKESHYSTAYFTVESLPPDTLTIQEEPIANRNIVFGFQSYHLSVTSSDRTMVLGALPEGAFILFNVADQSVSLRSYEGGKSGMNVKKFFDVAEGETYQIEVACFGRSIKASIKTVGTDEVTTLEGWRPESFKDCMRVCIGSGSDNMTIHWDNVSIRKLVPGSYLKNDCDVAFELVNRAFQGIIPMKKNELFEPDYFTTVVAAPNDNYAEVIQRLSLQANKQWYFDYDGSFVWTNRNLKEPVYTLSEGDINSLSLNYDPTGFRNWVEVVCPPNKEDSAAAYKNVYTRRSRADFTSIINHGIRYQLEEMDTIYTPDQADKVAVGKFYESYENMEEMEITPSYPMLFLQPRDEVLIDSNLLWPSVQTNGGIVHPSLSRMPQYSTEGKYERCYHLSSVTISASYGDVSMSLSLVSRWRSRMGAIADYYNEGGIPNQ